MLVMKSYRVFYREGMNTWWKIVRAENAEVAKSLVERSFWVLKLDRPIP